MPPNRYHNDNGMDSNEPTNSPRPNSWPEWFRYVMETIKTLNEKIQDLEKEITNLKLEDQKSLFQTREKITNDLQEIRKAVTELQQKFAVINGISTIVISVVISLVCKFLFKI